ncbi:MAG: TIGR00289 family protein [Nanoarchaeota archaeon]|nr:TIGR00289 family protein [Nanoarchaeota archaeon]MBU1134964.1 TIGR00289 family protein [Nanoarchaeota archaeon]MBU2519961.1 TIGR00289 family protein [Nanoarchaeota archaeon]
MKLGVLFSGGKDSTYALFKAMQNDEVVCLISVISKNKESYMFHTPNIEITDLQAEAIGLPLIKKETKGEKEKELEDLKEVIEEAKEKYEIEGIVTGAIESVYQSERIQKICNDLELKCINPIWKINQEKLLKELVEKKFKVIVSGVFAYKLDESWLGTEIDEDAIKKLVELKEQYQISPSGEGGEIETTVLDAPFFKKRIEILESEKRMDNDSGVFLIKKAKLVNK